MTEIFSVKREIPRQIRRSQRRVQFFAQGKNSPLCCIKHCLLVVSMPFTIVFGQKSLKKLRDNQILFV